MQELQVAFDMSYTDVFSVGGSEAFSMQVSNMAKHISIQCGTKSDGADIVQVEFDEATGTNIYE